MRDDYDHPSDWEPVKIKEDKMRKMDINLERSAYRAPLSHTHRREWPESPEATQHLIDAAPELLEALKLIVSVLPVTEENWGLTEDEATIFNIASTAIAKAEGKKG